MEVDFKVRKLAIYLHIPFCKHKCNYCDFNSFFIDSEDRISKYVDALCKEVEYYSEKSKDFEVSSVYFGGGTPSFIDEKYIEKIFKLIKSKYNFLDNSEVTIEVNPGTVNFEKLKRYHDIGINRLSMGVQTLNNDLLNIIGRVHDSRTAKECFYMAREAEFNNISLDIIFGLPKQELKDIEDTLNEFIILNPEHISAYALKIEPNTVFGKMYKNKELILPPEDIEREMYYLIKKKLKNNGYNQYEISNFSKEGYQAIHNTSYWKRQDYLGFGISASSCFNEVRFTNTYNFLEYINNPIENFYEREVLTKDIIDSEKIILGLRMLEGVNEDLFYKKEWKESLDKLINNGLVKRKNNVISLTDRGLDLANQVFVEFI